MLALGLSTALMALTRGAPQTGSGRSTTPVAVLERCAPAQLHLSRGELLSAATEQEPQLLWLTNRSTTECALTGYPRLELLTAHGTPVRVPVCDLGDREIRPSTPAAVIVRPGQRAYFVLNKGACELGETTQGVRVSVSLPGSRAGVLTASLQRPYAACRRTSIVLPNALDVSALVQRPGEALR